jgi:hypothetical protein
MRELRARITPPHGIELTPQQIQELAARRLEAILDPRTLTPPLLEQLKRGAGAVPEPSSSSADLQYEFEDTALYDSPRGALRVIRRILNPLLRLLFNPDPLARALHKQSRLNADAAAREIERDRRQGEWNALHYEILQRLVTEVARLSIEAAALAGRVESLGARVDFADRRVRALESDLLQPRPAAPRAVQPPAAPGAPAAEVVPGESSAPEGARRRRRRRRGRRPSIGVEGGPRPFESPAPAPSGTEAGAMATSAEGSGGAVADTADAAQPAPPATPSSVPAMPESPPRDEPAPSVSFEAPPVPAPTDR